MGRCIVTLLAVIAISAALGRFDAAQGQRETKEDWVRTSQGWQRRAILAAPTPPKPPTLHPFAVAAFQLTASLLVLIALPTHVRCVSVVSAEKEPQPHAPRAAAKRRQRRAAMS